MTAPKLTPPQAWAGPRWTLALLLACMGMLGPFSIDAYLPAFASIAVSVGATPVEMQQTLSSYLLGFAVMNLFHGALADSLGRRPVVIAGVAVFTLASVGCALSDTIGWLVFFRALQGLSAGAGMVVSRALIRDIYQPADAQRMMSQVTLFFGVAPAVAPLFGGLFYVWWGWHAIFWMLAGLGGALWFATLRWLPETLPADQRQPLNLRNLMSGYAQLLSHGRFMALVLASGVPFNGMFLYVLSAPVFLGEHLRLAPTQFFWFFFVTVSGIMGGAWLSGRLAGRIKPRHQVRHGFVIMLTASAANVVLNVLFPAHVAWSMWPVALFALGWSLQVSVVTLLALDQIPERRGMASSIQACAGSAANALVAGVLAPLVMHSALALALTSAALLAVGALAWIWVKPRVGTDTVGGQVGPGGGR